MARTIALNLLLKTVGTKNLKQATDQVGELRGKISGLGGAIAGLASGAALGSFLKDSVNAASDLGESISKVGVVFGKSAKTVNAFAANSATAFGQSKQQALEAAGTFGNLFVSMKIGQKESANMSTKLVALASDLASFNNTDPAEALDALRAGLVGETEPLRRFGINLNDAQLRAETLRLGLGKVGSTLTPLQKAQASYSLILKQSTTAQGDFARTSTGMANQQRIMNARLDDAKASIGQQLLPAMTGLVGFLSSKAIPALVTFSKFLGQNMDIILPLAGVILGIAAALKIWAIAQALVNAALEANPIVRVITIIALLIGALIAAYQRSETFRKIVQAAWKGIVTVALWAWNNVLKPTFEALKTFFVNVIAPAATWLWKNVFVPAFKGIATVATWLWKNIIYPAFVAMDKIIRGVIVPTILWLWKNIFTPAFKAIGFVVQVAWGIIKIIFAAIKMYITKIVAPVVTWLWKNIVSPAFTAIGKVISFVWTNGVKPIFDKFKAGLKILADAFKTAVGFIRANWDKIREAALKPVRWVVDVVYTKGIKAVWDRVADFVHAPHLPDAPRFATGGPVKGPGGTKADKIPIMASRDEFVVNAAATRRWLPLLMAINGGSNPARKASKMGLGDPGTPGFAGGGLIGWLGSFFKSAKDNFMSGIRNAAEKVLNPLGDWVQSRLGTTGIGGMIGGIPKMMIGRILDLIHKKEETFGGGPVAQRAVQLARTQIGVPYLWGGNAWNGGLDCSSLVQQSWQRARGKGGFPRTTYTQRPWLTRVGSPQPGDVGQPHPGHTYMYSGNGRVVEAPRTGLNIRERAVGYTPFWGRPPASWLKMDRGGMLPTGTSVIHNGTGRPEPVFTSMGQAASAVGGNTYTIIVQVAPGGDLAEAGRQTVKAIKEYERRAGKGWRS